MSGRDFPGPPAATSGPGSEGAAAADVLLDAVDREQAARLALRFGARAGSVRFLRQSANLVFRFERESGPAYLRVVPARMCSRAQVEGAHAYLSHLWRHEAPVCRPLPAQDGGPVQSRGDGDAELLAVAVGEVPGRPLDGEEREPAVFEQWGRALARLHNAAESFRPAPGHFFYTGDEGWRRTTQRLRDDSEPVRRAFAEIDAWRRGLPRGAGVGITHGDQNATNALHDGHAVHLVDFDEPTLTWWAEDVARPFREMTQLPSALLDELRGAFLHGYRGERAFPDDFEADLPRFERMKDLEVYGWLRAGQWAGSKVPGGASQQGEVERMRARFAEPLG